MINHQSSQDMDHGFGPTAEVCGIAPLCAVFVTALDVMMFGGEMASGFWLWFISAFVAFLMIIPCALIQRYSYRDEWPLAIGKAFVLSILTAIPTALPAALTIGWGFTGAVGLRYRAKRSPRIIDTDGEAYSNEHHHN